MNKLQCDVTVPEIYINCCLNLIGYLLFRFSTIIIISVIIIIVNIIIIINCTSFLLFTII